LKPGFESIKFAVEDIGFFPNQRYPNVVFIGLAEEGSNSAKLVEFIDKILASFQN
jgi:2'-5' RNA ligase